MDSYGFIDSIQVEKANALARYKRFNNISIMFRAIEVFIAVALISWTSTRLPTVFKLSGEYLYACSPYVMNQHVVFLVGNVIVVLCYVLSGRTELGIESDKPAISEENSYYRSNNNRKTRDADSNIDPAPPPVEVLPDIKTDREIAIVKTEPETDPDPDPETAIKQAAKQIERFHRTQSAKLSREISTKPRRDLRRSVTEIQRRRSVDGDGDGDSTTSLIETVESLSNEEFRLAVEAFISKQQSLLKQQTM